MNFNAISSNNVYENNIKHVVLPFDNDDISEREVVNSERYINERSDFTIAPPRNQNIWSDPGGGIDDSFKDKGCSIRYSNNQNALSLVCGEDMTNNDDWVRGNVFSNKFPYKLHHKVRRVPTVKIIRNNPIIKKNSPYWPEPMTYKNINMYDYKTYPDLRNESRDTDGKPMFRYPYNPINLDNSDLNTIETFSIGVENEDIIKYIIALLVLFGICYIIKK